MIQPAGFPKLPDDFEYDSEVHPSLDGENAIFMNIFKRKGVEPRRGLLISHGLGEHGGRYLHFPHYLKSVYDLIVAVDLRGHGRSEGVRGHVERFDEYVDDYLLAFDVLQRKSTADTRLDIFGHSMGGLVALRALKYRPDLPIQHAIISGPALGNKVPVPFLKEMAGRFLAKVWGSFQMESGIDANLLSHDPHVVEAHSLDRLIHTKATPKFYFSILEMFNEMHAQSIKPKADTKILLQLAGEEYIVDDVAAKRFFENLKHENKKMITYPGLYHEIYNETTKEQVFEDLIRFVERAV